MAKDIDVRLYGERELTAAILAQIPRVRRKSQAAITQGARKIERNIQRLLNATSHLPNTPTPAPAGGPPSRITGRLARSIEVRVNGTRATIASTDYRSAFQEYGTGRQPRRPFMSPSVAANRLAVNRLCREAWRSALN